MPKKSAKKVKTCTQCGIEKSVNSFYKVSNPQVSSDGEYANICKTCIKKNVINSDGSFNIDNFKRMLQIMDKPYVPLVLNSAISESKRAHDSGTGRMDIVGNYIKGLGLWQYKDVGFLESLTMFNEDNVEFKENKDYLNINYDPKEKIYSKKWRGEYTQDDIDYLDDYYAQLEKDYKIVTANHKDYAKKIAKASLQMDKTFDEMANGIKGAEARYKSAREAFDTLSKSAKFSESTRSASDIGLGSFSQIVEKVEQHNWIPEHIPVEKDDIDQLIDYLSTITKSF